MDFGLLPFTTTKKFDSVSDTHDEIVQSLAQWKEDTRIDIASASKDHKVTETTRKRGGLVITAQFEHEIYGIPSYESFSNQVLSFIVHDERENEQEGLAARKVKYNAHKIHVKIPRFIHKPFFIFLKDPNGGILLAPWGTPKRVRCIIKNDLGRLPIRIGKKREFNGDEMDALLERMKREATILWISANVQERETKEYFHLSKNFGSSYGYDSFKKFKQKYPSFKLDSIICSVEYQKEPVSKSGKLTLRALSNKATVSTSLPQKERRDMVAQANFYEWLGKLLTIDT